MPAEKPKLKVSIEAVTYEDLLDIGIQAEQIAMLSENDLSSMDSKMTRTGGRVLQETRVLSSQSENPPDVFLVI